MAKVLSEIKPIVASIRTDWLRYLNFIHALLLGYNSVWCPDFLNSVLTAHRTNKQCFLCYKWQTCKIFSIKHECLFQRRFSKGQKRVNPIKALLHWLRATEFCLHFNTKLISDKRWNNTRTWNTTSPETAVNLDWIFWAYRACIELLAG